jgi:nicotinate-nucleotide adenylyltransferase
MRIALFGGSFDPPHSGHLGIAMAAVERLHLDRVLMAPVGRQPLKRDQVQSPFEDRMVMVQLACAGHSPIAASAIDAPRVDCPPATSSSAWSGLTRCRPCAPGTAPRRL